MIVSMVLEQEFDRVFWRIGLDRFKPLPGLCSTVAGELALTFPSWEELPGPSG